MAKKAKTYWRWVGHREFIPGVPARDMSQEEVDRRGLNEIVEASKLFEKTKEDFPVEETEDQDGL